MNSGISKNLLKSGAFLMPLFPQLGFILILINLGFSRKAFIPCFKADIADNFNRIILGLLGISFIASLIFSIAFTHSITYMLYIFFLILGYYSLRVTTLPTQDILRFFLFGVSVDTIFGILQWMFHIEFVKQLGPLLVDISFGGGNRITSLAGHPMVLAGLATFGFIAGIILFKHYTTRIRYLYLSLAICAFIAELLTQSRADFIILVIGLTLLLALYYKKIIITIVAIFIVITSSFLFMKYQAMINDTSMLDRVNNSATTNIRLSMWKDSIQLIKQKPFLGYGPDNWQKAVQTIAGDKYGSISDPHNTFLRLCVDFGVIFAVLFYIFIVTKLITRFLDKNNNIISTGGIVAITLLLMLGLMDNPLSSIHMTSMFILFGSLIWRYNTDSEHIS